MGEFFYVADLTKGGLILIDPDNFRQIGFIKTGVGTHSIYPSRDGRYLYVGNRGCAGIGCNTIGFCPPHGPGSVAVVDPRTQQVVANWSIPNGGSPDMGNVTADGKELWLSGRYDSEVYVFDTATGQLTHRIAVGQSPHGLAVWPQPGRYSLGHTVTCGKSPPLPQVLSSRDLIAGSTNRRGIVIPRSSRGMTYYWITVYITMFGLVLSLETLIKKCSCKIVS